MFFSCGCYDCGQTYLKLFLACFFLSISKLIPNFLFLTQGEFMHESKSQCKRHWHPAFFAGLQIELSEERSNLIFENEHLLGTKPTQIDVIIVKKNGDIPIKKNIGQIFRKYNIIEYKSPSDYLSIDDFYKVYAYACFYKSLSEFENQIDISEITITFVSKKYPYQLIKHLKNVRNYKIKKNNPGIYYIKGDFVPIQFIVTSELEKKENLWLYSLTDELCGEKDVVQLIQEYKKHQNQYLYESVMDIIVRANADRFKEGDNVCRALEEIMLKRMREELEERERLGVNIGISQGIIQGEQYFALLTQSLLSDSRINDLQKAIVDCDFRRGLYMEYGIGRDEGFCEGDGG